MKEHILVIGSNGMLGSVVSRYLSNAFDVTGTTSDDFNILNDSLDKLKPFIKDNTFSVINCAGVIKPRIQFYEIKDVFKINSLFPIQLSQWLDKLVPHVGMIHISTDCVFTGKTGNYDVNDIPDATDLYGMSKILGESCTNRAQVIRTSIIGEELNNKYSLIEWAKSEAGNEVSGWTDHIWSGVTTLQLAKFIKESLENNWVYSELIHYASEPINKYKLLKLINKTYNLNLTVHKIDSGNPCNRSLYVYDKTMLAPSLQDQLVELKEFFDELR
jgi:dTDP-4-dehydrorhamnose reductase